MNGAMNWIKKNSAKCSEKLTFFDRPEYHDNWVYLIRLVRLCDATETAANGPCGGLGSANRCFQGQG